MHTLIIIHTFIARWSFSAKKAGLFQAHFTTQQRDTKIKMKSCMQVLLCQLYLRVIIHLVEFYANPLISHCMRSWCSYATCLLNYCMQSLWYTILRISLGLHSVPIFYFTQFSSFVLLQMGIIILICAFKISCSLIIYPDTLLSLFFFLDRTCCRGDFSVKLYCFWRDILLSFPLVTSVPTFLLEHRKFIIHIDI